MASITCVQGDIAQQDVDAIVNAANHSLLGGGGVDGAIHRAAGQELLLACRALPDVRGVRCPTGEARITPGFQLKARWVLHAVGPIYSKDPDPARSLARSLESSLALAVENGARTVAVPAISCGAYGYPAVQAAKILVDVARRATGIDEVRFVLFDLSTLAVFTRALADIKKI